MFQTQYNFNEADLGNFEPGGGISLTEIYPNHPFTIPQLLARSQVDPEVLKGFPDAYFDNDFDEPTLKDFQIMSFAELEEARLRLQADLDNANAQIAALASRQKEQSQISSTQTEQL